MELRQMGRSGLRVSVMGLGCNNFGQRIDAAASARVVHAAIDAGVTFFDTAESYGRGASEEHLGAALAGRDGVTVATKFAGRPGPPEGGAARLALRRSCEGSLRRLGRERIDLYYLHFPDPATPLDETLETLDDLVREGKVGYAACSNVAAWQLADAQHLAGTSRSRFVAVQTEWSLLQRKAERELVPAALHFGVGIVPYFPLAAGLLTGKYKAGEPPPEDSRLGSWSTFASYGTPERLARVEHLAALAEELGRPLIELALAWLRAKPGVASVLVGATSPAQVQVNTAAIQADLSSDDLARIDEATA